MYRIPSVACLTVALLFATLAPSGAAPDVVLYASDVTAIHGNWSAVSDASAAGGLYLSSPDAGWSSVDVPLAQPTNYFEVGFTAAASTPYHVWFRLRAGSNSKYNDSAWVQYSDAVKNGAPVYAIGSASALLVNLENCGGCGESGWGWKDGAYWLSQAATIQFSSTGTHTLRIQVREDGVQIDQIVLSPSTYLTQAPGGVTNDATIVPKVAPPPPATSTPYLGTPAAIPGIVKAENFDNGGPGVAYADSTPGNAGNAYRATDVDLQPSSIGGYNVGWVDVGEWLNYTVSVAAAGQYTVRFKVASAGQGGTFHLEMNRNDVTGPLTIPNTGGWQAWQTLTSTVSLAAGQQTARLVIDAPGSVVGNFGPFEFATVSAPPPPPPPPPPPRSPFSGTPVPVPGTIEAENFDNGGTAVAYSDTTPGNAGGMYRPTDVDIEASSEGGFDVGWTAPGEWLTYGVNVTASGSYLLQLRVASPGAANSVHVSFDHTSNGSWAISIPQTGGWQTWATTNVPVTLSAGVQQMTVTFDTGGINLNGITVTAASPPSGQPSVNVWLTSKDGSRRLAQQPAVTFVAGSGNSALPTITVDDSVRYQQIEGFGGSFTDSGAWMLSSISPDSQAAILTALFDRNAGIGLGFLRQPIGSSDFARTAYTFNDISPTSTDYTQANFSIEHDRAYILPALRAARAVNPAIRVLASPWTAPAWMKTSRTLSDGGNLKPDAFAAYAKYFVKFIQAYQAEGVPIDSLTVQNEPLTAPPYPSMVMSSTDQATFIGQHLGPALAAAGLNPRVFAWDHNWETTYPFAVLSNPSAAAYISGVAFHCYGGQPDAMSAFHQAYPQLDIVLSECADGSRATFGDKLIYDVYTTLIGSLRNWARSVAKWNLVLDENGGPKLYTGTCRNCTGLVTINSATGAVSYNEDYYALGHASRFIQRGSYRVDSTAFGYGGIANVAVANPDGSIAVLAVNAGDNTQTFQIKSRGATVQYTLEAGSVATFKWTPR